MLDMSLPTLALLLAAAQAALGFTFSHTDPVECQNLTLQWQGGTPPFYATVVPAYPLSGARIQNVSIPTTGGPMNRTFSFQLNNPANLEFSVIMSDATGWGSGGVTPVLQISGSNDQSCHRTPATPGFFFYTDPVLSISSAQCQSIRLSWDNTITYPLKALGFIPGGSAFEIPVPQTRGSVSANWPVSIREGAQYQILMADANTSGGSTNLTWVTGGSSNCLNANSPSAGVRVATVISNGVSSTRSLTSLRSSSGMPSSSAQADGANSGSGGGASSNVGAIVGGVVGGIAALALGILLLFCCRRRRRRAEQEREDYRTTPGVEIVNQPEMRQAPLSMGPAAVMRRATRSMGQSHSRQPSRQSFDILSVPAGAPVTPPMLESPLSTEDAIDPFVSPFPAPPPRSASDGQEAVPWGAARGHVRDSSSGTLESLTPDTAARGLPVLAPLNVNRASGSTNRASRKLSGQFGETAPHTPTMRPTSVHQSPIYRSMSSSRWSVDDDEQIGAGTGTQGSRERLSDVMEGRVAPTTTTIIQHNDGGPGGVVELPPSYAQLRARNPDE